MDGSTEKGSAREELGDQGERAIVARLLARIAAAPDTDRLLVPAGDDAAAVALPESEAAVLTTDTLVEDVHFRPVWTTARDLGWKLVTSAASDVSAMGAKPLAVVVSITAPERMRVDELEALTAGELEACAAYGIALAGGDTSAGRHLVLTATVLGSALSSGLVRRSGAQVGDVVGVTGVLGEATAGLGALEVLFGAEKPEAEWALRPRPPLLEVEERLIELGADQAPAAAIAGAAARFLCPAPTLPAGPILAAAGVTSMIDISDGLASESYWIADCSGVGIAIDQTRVPIGPGARAWADRAGRDPLSMALGGGEDYELLFTVPRELWVSLVARLQEAGIHVTAIGDVVPASEGCLLVTPAGDRRPMPHAGHEHFRRHATIIEPSVP